VHRSSATNFAERLLERLGNSACLIDAAGGQIFSGRELPESIAGFAAGFLAAGLRPGERLLIGCTVTPPSTLAYLGAIYAGIVPVLTEERLLASSGEALVIRARAKAVWTTGGNVCEWARKNEIPQLVGLFEPRRAETIVPHPCAENDLAALMPTSGSTGVPRLVMVSHGNLLSNTEAIIRSQHLGADERAMLIMPVSYCFGASVVHSHLYQGGGVVFDSRFMFPDKVLHAINTHRCTTFAGVPTVYNVLLRRSNLRTIPLPGLRRFLQAGGALGTESVREMRAIVPGAKFYVMYGQTEATARISCLSPECLEDKPGSAGLALDNLEVRIASEKGAEMPAGEVGEIQVRGPSVCLGYLDDPEATERKFGGGWLKTGDFASRDADGFLWIKGRTDDFLKIRGVRVSLGEVESKVASVAGVSECAAVGVRHPEAGEALALLVVADEGKSDGSFDLAERVRRALPAHWTCQSVKVVSQLPRTANGKVARAQLAAMI
jgi:acyl-CoA synthetase (AMP-forming)/AMP-acid ligase II